MSSIPLPRGETLEARINAVDDGRLELHVRNPTRQRIIIDRMYVDGVGCGEILIRITSAGVRVEVGGK